MESDDEISGGPELPVATQTGSSTQYSLYQIELENFKSYKGKHVVGPFHPFTCVIGPNGSGKSNITDAVAFALGVRSTGVRAPRVQDLVYKVDSHAEKKCSVTFVMRARGEDKKGKQKDELRFQRTAVAATGTSEYRLNEKLVPYADYEKKLRQLGIHVTARNYLVMQGEVERIAYKPGIELTALVEELCGSADMKERYNALKAETLKADQKLHEKISALKDAKFEKHHNDKQTTDAKKYKQLLEAQRQLKLDLFLFQFYFIDSAINTGKTKIDELNQKYEQLTSKHKSEISEMEKAKSLFEDLKKKSDKNDINSRDVTKRIVALTGQKDKLQSDISTCERRITDIKKQKTTAESNMKLAKSQKTELEQQISLLHKKKAELDKVSEKKASLQKLLGDKYDEFQRIKGEAHTRTITQRQEIDRLQKMKGAEESTLRVLQNQRGAIRDRVKNIETTIQEFKERQISLQSVADRTSLELLSTKKQHDDLKGEVDQKDVRVIKLERELQTTVAALQTLRVDKQDVERGEKTAQTMANLMKLFPGVKGLIPDILKVVDPKYRVAVTVAMGSNIGAVVVDTEKTAQDCIRYLREQLLSPMTFIPVDMIAGSRIAPALRNLGGSCKPVIDCIRFDKQMEAVASYAVGSCLVCDKLSEAKEVAFGQRDKQKYKVVTLDGTMIRKSGIISGGQATFQKKAAAKWDVLEYSKLKERRDKLLGELGVVKNVGENKERIARLSHEAQKLQQTFDNATADLKVTQRKLDMAHKELELTRKTDKELDPKEKESSKKIEDLVNQLQTVTDTMNKVSLQELREFEAKVGMKDLATHEERSIKESEELRIQKSQVDEKLNKLVAQIGFVEQHLKKLANPAELEKEEKRLVADLEESKPVMEKVMKEYEQKKKAADEFRKMAADLKKDSTAAYGKLTTLRETNRGALVQIEGIKKNKNSQVATLEALRSRRTQLYMKAKTEDVELPLVKSDQGKKRKAEQLNYSEPFMVGSDEKSLDFTKLASDLKKVADNHKEHATKAAEMETKLNDINHNLLKLAPNFKNDANDETNVKFREANGEYEAAKATWGDINRQLTKVREARAKLFLEAVTSIDRSVRHIYQQLTKSATGLGGAAFIMPEGHSDEPFEKPLTFSAVPPAKRHHSMAQLSGGEKSIAALALLFAIHRAVNPTPFLILDEVDAALDADNLNKTLQFIQEYSKHCQFIVISLKPQFFCESPALIGIYKDEKKATSSTLTYLNGE